MGELGSIVGKAVGGLVACNRAKKALGAELGVSAFSGEEGALEDEALDKLGATVTPLTDSIISMVNAQCARRSLLSSCILCA